MAEDQGFDPTQFGAVALEEPKQEAFDPTQHGAIPVQQEERSIPSKIGHAVVDTLKGFLPQSVEDVAMAPFNAMPGFGQAIRPLANVAFGHPVSEGVSPLAGIPVVQRIPEIIQAEKTPALSQERFTTAAGTLLDLAMVAGAKAAPEIAAKPGLADVVEPLIPKAPEAAPETTAPISTAAAIETPKEVTPDATQKGQVAESIQPERPRDDRSGLPAETGGGGSVQPETPIVEAQPAEPVAQEPVAPTVPQPEPAAARPEPPEPATFSVESPTDVFGSEHTPVSSFLTENKVMSKSTARKNGMLEKNPDLWDDATNLSHPTHNKIYEQGGGLPPDIAAQMLHDAGLIPDADVGTMWKTVGDESKSARSTLKAEQGQVADIKQQAGQVKDFSEAQHDEWEKGKPVVQVKDLQVGDTVTVKGESMKVADIDPDTFDVTLEDGRKFGVQTVKDNTVIYGEHEAGPVARTPTVEPPAETPALEVPKTTEPTAPIAEQPNTVPTPAETQAMSDGEDKVGIAERYREEEQPGSVIPGVGRTADEARDWGQKFINKGGNPYDVIANKGPKRELWQDVGVVRAEYERLSNEKRAAESAWEANPDDPELKIQFEHADAAQRQWSKDAQSVLTRAGDALRAASRSYPREINSFSDFTDIVNDHFKGEVELTPEKRAELQKAVKAIRKGNAEATEARAQVTNEAVKKAGGKTMSFDDLKTSLTEKMTKLLENCPT